MGKHSTKTAYLSALIAMCELNKCSPLGEDDIVLMFNDTAAMWEGRLMMYKVGYSLYNHTKSPDGSWKVDFS